MAQVKAPHDWKAHDFTVWIALVVLLALGWAVKTTAEGRQATFADSQGPLRVQYPARWLPIAGRGGILDVEDPLSGELAPTRLVVTRAPLPHDQTIDQIAQGDILARAKELDLYRALSTDAKTVAGKPALVVEYAFVVDLHGGALAAERVPAVVRGLEVIVPTDAFVYRLDFQATDASFDSVRTQFDTILRQIVL